MNSWIEKASRKMQGLKKKIIVYHVYREKASTLFENFEDNQSIAYC